MNTRVDPRDFLLIMTQIYLDLVQDEKESQSRIGLASRQRTSKRSTVSRDIKSVMHRLVELGRTVNVVSSSREKIWEESKKMWGVTFPAILSRICSHGIFIVTQAFIGHISSTGLAAYALLQILGFRFVTGIMVGMSSATQTLCGQAFGAKQYHMLGIYLQRSWVVNFFVATTLLPIFIFARPILILLGEDDKIVEAVGHIAPWFIPTVYFTVFSLTFQQFLQSQLKNRIVGFLSGTLLVIHLFLSWLFVSVLDQGIPGAMTAIIISTWSIVIGEFVYIFGGWCPNTWRGFTVAAIADLWPVIKLSISSGIMLCLELWYNAILVLLASYMKNASVAISAFSICLSIASWEFMICLGFLTGASVRVSNELGRRNPGAARFAIKVNLGTSIVVGLCFWILCLVLGRRVAYLFTSDEQVAEEVSNLIVLLAFTVLLNSVQPVLSGVAIGSGRQGMVAWLNVISYYVIGVPLGVGLAYGAHFGVRGIWIGMLIGSGVQTIWLGALIWRTDWKEQVDKASERMNTWLMRKPEEMSDGAMAQTLSCSSEE